MEFWHKQEVDGETLCVCWDDFESLARMVREKWQFRLRRNSYYQKGNLRGTNASHIVSFQLHTTRLLLPYAYQEVTCQELGILHFAEKAGVNLGKILILSGLDQEELGIGSRQAVGTPFTRRHIRSSVAECKSNIGTEYNSRGGHSADGMPVLK